MVRHARFQDIRAPSLISDLAQGGGWVFEGGLEWMGEWDTFVSTLGEHEG